MGLRLSLIPATSSRIMISCDFSCCNSLCSSCNRSSYVLMVLLINFFYDHITDHGNNYFFTKRKKNSRQNKKKSSHQEKTRSVIIEYCTEPPAKAKRCKKEKKECKEKSSNAY